MHFKLKFYKDKDESVVCAPNLTMPIKFTKNLKQKVKHSIVAKFKQFAAGCEKHAETLQ